MKKIYLPVILVYTFLLIYYAIFNWHVFILNLDVNLGFGSIKIPLIAILMAVSLTLLILQWVSVSISMLKHDRDILKKDNEIVNLKLLSQQNTETDIQKMSQTLTSLDNKVRDFVAKPAKVSDSETEQVTNSE